MKVLMILAMIISSCGQDSLADQDSNLASYVNRFEEVYGIEVSDVIPVTFDDLNSAVTNQVGVCTINDADSETKEHIEIDVNAWATFNDAEKEEVVFHEIGHCLLDRPHSNKNLQSLKYGQIPASVMSPSLLPSDIYLKFRDYYRNELINNSIYRKDMSCQKEKGLNLILPRSSTKDSRPPQKFWRTRESKVPSNNTNNSSTY